MAVLAKRLEELKTKSVKEQLQSALNWRQGRCSRKVVAMINDWVRKIRFQADVICLGTYGGLLLLVDMSRKGLVMGVLTGLSGEITALDFDGRRVVAGTIDGAVGIWSMNDAGEWSGREVANLGATCTGVHLSGDVATAVSLTGSVRVWEQGQAAETVELRESVSCFYISDGYAFAGLRDGRVMVYAASGGRLKGGASGKPVKEILSFAAHGGEVTCIQYLKGEPEGDGDMIITGSFDGTLKSWDLESSSLLHTFKGHAAAVCCFQADSEKLVSGARDGSIRIWSMRDGSYRYRILGHTAYLDALQFEGDRLIASGTNNVVVSHDFTGAEGGLA